jgi:hypothetical protein
MSSRIYEQLSRNILQVPENWKMDSIENYLICVRLFGEFIYNLLLLSFVVVGFCHVLFAHIIIIVNLSYFLRFQRASLLTRRMQMNP